MEASSNSPVHVIDADIRRRAQTAHQLTARGIHVEIYDGVEEYKEAASCSGVMLAADDPCQSQVPLIMNSMREKGVILPLAMYAEKPPINVVVRAILEGALDYLEWPFDFATLDVSLIRLRRQDNSRLRLERIQTATHLLVETLTKREGDVFRLMTEGLSNKAMAEKLGISRRTIEVHRGSVMAKLKARSTADAVRIGLQTHSDLRKPVH